MPVNYSNVVCRCVLTLGDALQEIRDSFAHINEFGGSEACELAKSPGRTKILKVELTGVMKTALQ
jgi:hypothetical protein